MPNTEYSFWLLPAQPLYGRLCAMIKSLATAHNAVEFEPHVTIYSGPSNDAESSDLLCALCESFDVVSLSISNADMGTSYTKSLFLEVAESTIIKAMHTMVKALSSAAQEYALLPHLSLLYQNPNVIDLNEIKKGIIVPAGEFLFDRIKLIETEVPVTGAETIQKWRVIKQCQLASVRRAADGR